MRIKKTVLGLTAVAAVAVAVLSACSSGSTSSASAAPAVAPAAAHTASSTAAPVPSTADTPAGAPVPAVATVAPQQAQAPATAQQAAAVTPGVPCAATARACVSLSKRTAWLLQNGQVVYGPVRIMPGSPKFPTPTGTFHVLFQNAHYRSHEFHNAPMPESTFFYPGDAFHVGSLSVYSHGCIHMSWSSATTFFNTLKPGDVVQVVS